MRSLCSGCEVAIIGPFSNYLKKHGYCYRCLPVELRCSYHNKNGYKCLNPIMEKGATVCTSHHGFLSSKAPIIPEDQLKLFD